MSPTKFTLKNKQVFRVGNSFAVVIDAAFFHNGYIKEDDVFDVDIIIQRPEEVSSET